MIPSILRVGLPTSVNQAEELSQSLVCRFVSKEILDPVRLTVDIILTLFLHERTERLKT